MNVKKIRIPVVGFENAGKSTVIDALLQGEYTQTSLLVCTKAVYHFPIHNADKTTEPSKFETVSQINQMVQAVNACTKNKLNTRTFPIKMRTPLCQDMMENTQLEIIDVPGWKESAASQDPGTNECIAKGYITENWNTFGLVLVVLDLTCSNEEARTRNKELLRSLHDLNRGKEIPVLILGNKVDAFEDDGVKEAIELMGADVETSFHSSMQEIKFIALSAKNALYYRHAMGLDYADFESYYANKMNQIGKLMHTERGWKRKNRSSKNRELLEDLQNEAIHESVMSENDSNFGSLLRELNVQLGGQDNQRAILKRALELKLRKFNWTQNGWFGEIISVSKDLHSIGVPDQSTVVRRFWDMHDRFLSKAMSDFEEGMDFNKLVQATGPILEAFKTQVGTQMLSDESEELKQKIERTKWDVANQCFKVIRKKFNARIASNHGKKIPSRPTKKARTAKTAHDKTAQDKTAQDTTPWDELTAFDWKRILQALAQEVPFFHCYFPAMGKFLNGSLHSFGEGWGLSLHDVREMEQSTKGIYDDESCEFVPNDKQKYAIYAKLEMGHNRTFTHPEHWGHIPWLVLPLPEV